MGKTARKGVIEADDKRKGRSENICACLARRSYEIIYRARLQVDRRPRPGSGPGPGLDETNAARLAHGQVILVTDTLLLLFTAAAIASTMAKDASSSTWANTQ